MVCLRSWDCSETSLDAALASCANLLNGATALLYSPKACHLGQLRDCQVFAPSGSDHGGPLARLDTSSVFEARMFNADGELRWWHDPDTGRGRAVWLTESTRGPEGNGWKAGTPRNVETHENQYLLWGECMDHPAAGWSRLAAARIGSIAMPLSLASDARGAIKTVEYFGEAPGEAGAHGNVSVVAERLAGLAPVHVEGR